MNKKVNKPCNFFANGNCKKGDQCPFLHSEAIMDDNNQNNHMNHMKNVNMNQMNNMKISKPCNYFANGTCKKGDNCQFIHSGEIISNNSQQIKAPYINENKSFGGKICRKFHEGKCDNENCNFSHKYSSNLQHMAKVPIYQNSSNISGICKTPNSNSLITATENKITIWELPLKVKDEKVLEGKITNMIFSNYKLIASTQLSLTFSAKSRIYIFQDENFLNFDPEAKNINDIIEIIRTVTINDIKEQISIIFIAGEGFVEVFGLRKNEIQKINSLTCDDHSEVLTLAFHDEKSMLFAGFKSGNLVAWQLDEINFKLVGLIKLHNESINKIIFHKTNYLISCSSDSNVKIYDLINDKPLDFNIGVQSPIIDLFLSKNYENEDIFIFFLKNSDLVAFKEGESGFQKIFSVPSTQSSNTRFVLDYENPKSDKNNGEYLLFTDGPLLDINIWEPEQKENFQRNNNNFQQNYQNQSNFKSSNKFGNNNPNLNNNYGSNFQNKHKFHGNDNNQNYSSNHLGGKRYINNNN